MIDIQTIPAQAQRQDALASQLADLIAVANRLGMYDAADAISQIAQHTETVKYGCHCDLETDTDPDGCVIDQGEEWACIFAKKGMRKEQCKYWRIIARKAQP